jgi:hypothetical protein
VKDYFQSCLLVLVVACTGLGPNEPKAGAALTTLPPLPPMPPGFKPRMATTAAPEVSAIQTPQTNEFRVSIRAVPLLSLYVYPFKIDTIGWSGALTSALTNLTPEQLFKATNKWQRNFYFCAPTGNWSEYQWEQSDGSGEWVPVGSSAFTNVQARPFKTTFAFAMVQSNDNKAVRLRMIGYPTNVTSH